MIDEKWLELTDRKTETRESSPLSCVVFDINQIYVNFHNSIKTIETDLEKGKELEKEGKKSIARDIYRFLVACLESSFDFFIHCVVKLGFKEMYLQERDQTDRYRKYPIPLGVVTELLSDTTNSEPLVEYINDRTAAETYLSYNKFKDALAFIDESLLSNVVDELYPINKYEDLKLFIEGIYMRRNLIAHQDDRVHSTGKKAKISYTEVQNYKIEMVKLVDCIIRHLKGML